MNIVVFSPNSPKVRPINGFMLQRQGMLLEVAWDTTPERSAAIGWIRLCKQISFKKVERFSWISPALKLISSGNEAGGREAIAKAEKERQLERARKENMI
jgi:hypothetical protein